MSVSSLASLKTCVSEFNPDRSLDDEGSENLEKKWEKWLENLEVCLDFEGVQDSTEANSTSKKRAALLAGGGSKLREIFKTLDIENDSKSYDAAKTALNSHFTAKKNLTAERFKFFCTKPESADESHDHYITRLRTKVADCEFDKMDKEEAIKLVVTLHTHSAKLQREIIAQNMDLKKLIETARAIEMTTREVEFMKTNKLEYKDAREEVVVHKVNRFERRGGSQNFEKGKKCWSCGGPFPHKDVCRAKSARCNKCKRIGHFAKVCKSTNNRTREVNVVCEQTADSESDYEYNMDSLSSDTVCKDEGSTVQIA